jgi:puromycin-sensitive aminopeptidase
VEGAESHRLPRDVLPRRYELQLQPRLAESRYDGTVAITAEVVNPSRTIVLNALGLEIRSARVETPDGQSHPATVEIDEAEQRLSLTFPVELAAGTGYRLQMEFAGVLDEGLRGFYRSTFRGDDGVDQVIATTQFEPADARRAFPCWDEPDFKATFAITLIVDEELAAVSNEQLLSAEPLGDGRKRVTFAETMVMSTYLVAFVVGPYALGEPIMVDDVPLRVIAVPARSHLTGHAREVASHAVRFLSGYFEIPYPGGKIDHIAVPDFAFGAMENLGCVTYRENALLADPARASHLELQRIATVVAHETAHMWFGDLVTMKWWNGIWLNEAFATFMELTTTEAFRPEWQVWTAFGAGKSAALVTDGLQATRPVEFPVRRPEDIESMFDVLTYQKGGAVLRMLEQYLGSETFRKGISHYLRTHAYGNTETTDLWDAIEEVSGEPVRAIMDSWIQQRGYPIIFVEMGQEPGTVSLRQQRFLNDGTTGPEQWAVPINFRASVGGTVQHQRLLLDDTTALLDFDGPLDWLVVNDGAWGFYRVRYSPELRERLWAGGVTTILDPLEQLGLVIDTWAALVAGMADVDELVSVLEAVSDDVDPDVWGAIAAVLGSLEGMAGDEDRAAVQRFVRRVAAPAWARLGWDPSPGESRRTATARARVLSVLGLVGRDPEVRQEASDRFTRFLADPSSLAPDVVAVASRITVSAGGEPAWSLMVDQFRKAEVPQDKLRYLDALGDTNDPVLRAATLDIALTPEVRTQDAPFLISSAMTKAAGGPQTWEWVVSHWDQLKAQLPAGLLTRIFDGIAGLADADVAESVHAFCAEHEIPLIGARLDQLLERMDINVALAARLRGRLGGALGRR